MNFFRWLGSSFVGCTFGTMMLFATPGWLMCMSDLRDQGNLTIGTAIGFLILACILGAIGGALGWFLIMKPFRISEGLDSRGEKKKQK